MLEDDVNSLARVLPGVDISVAGGDGSFLFDTVGRRYIDFVMGWCVGNLGWNHATLKDRIRNFNGPDYVCPEYNYPAWEKLAAMLLELAPGNMSRAFRCTGGMESVEIALQASMAYTGRSEFVSVEDSYHGHSLGTMSLGLSSFRSRFPHLMSGCHKLQLPLNTERLSQVEQLLGTEKIAAVIMEPILCNLAVDIPDPEFMRGLQALCRRHGSLLILDEVATGFGRTGKFLACEHYGLQPDILCLGKAITSGYAGLGATLVTHAVAQSMDFEFSCYSSYGWHPLSTEVAIANIAIMRDTWRELERNIAARSAQFFDHLQTLHALRPFALRVKGLAIGIKFPDAKIPAMLARLCRQRGLLIHGYQDAIMLFPALTITSDVVEEGLNILSESVAELDLS